MEAITSITGIGVPLTRSNVDTDQIIPAEFLKRVTKTGFDDALFQRWRQDPDFVLNQLYKYSPLQDSFSVIFLALVDGKPRVMNLKEMLQEFVRHRVIVIRRRTQFLLSRARKRKHPVQGLLLAHANIDEVIRVIRASKTQPEAKQRLMEIRTPGALMRRALGDDGFAQFQAERGVAEEYTLTPVQADAILKMTLGQLVNLEQEKLAEEHAALMAEIGEYMSILADEARIGLRQAIREIDTVTTTATAAMPAASSVARPVMPAPSLPTPASLNTYSAAGTLAA